MGLNFSETPEILNFVIAGQVSGGHKLLAEALNSYELDDHPSPLTCHSVLLSENPAVRRYYHEVYFGPSGNTPDWLVEGHISGEQYLTNKIFDNALLGEKAIGVCVIYKHMYDRDLWDYFLNWCRSGDFCLINLNRNPFSCFACIKLWERNNFFLRDVPSAPYQAYTDVVGAPCPYYSHFPATSAPVHISVSEAIDFARAHVAANQKSASMCDDRLEVGYEELVGNFYRTSEEILRFLDLPLNHHWSVRWTRYFQELESVPLRRMIANWDSLCSQLPPDLKELADPGAL